MHALYELKEMLCKELENYGKKGELTAGSLEVIDKLAHTVKNLDKIIEAYEEEEYSSRGSYEGRGGSYEGRGGPYEGRGGSYRSYRGSNRSYRGRSNAMRDSRGRYSGEGYSRAEEMADRLRDLMEEAPDDRTRQEIQNLISRMDA